MTKNDTVQRDRRITRSIHRLFWKAHLQHKPFFFGSILLHIPAFFIYNVLIPFQIAYALQAIILKDFNKISHYIWIILLLTVLYNVFMWVAQWMFSRHGVIGGQYVQKTIFSSLIRKDYDFYSNSFFGALGAQAARFRDAYIEYNGITMFDVLKQITVVITSIVIIAMVSIPLALVTLICMAVVLSFTILSSSWRLKYRRLVSEASSELAGALGDALTHGTTVKSFATESQEEARLQKSLNVWGKAQQKSWDLFAPANAGRTVLGAITTCVVLVLTAHMYQQGTITIAIVALVQLYVIRLILSTQEISEIIKVYETIMGAAYQPMRTMLIEPIIVDAPNTKNMPKNAVFSLEFQQVHYSYSDAATDNAAVKNFTLTIAAGEKIGLVGYSGSGKTTLTKLLLRFMDITKGNISIGGVDIRDLSQQQLRTHIAYVPQEPLLFHRTIAENITYARPHTSKKQLQTVAKLAYVHEFVEDLPKGYDTLVGERGVKLSGGQRQRVAIARALLKDAPILVLDEATSALDSRSEKLIQQALWRLMKQRTALVIAHRLSTIQHMDRIVVMDKGKIVQIGTHQELLKQKNGIYAKLWSHQSGGYLGGIPSES